MLIYLTSERSCTLRVHIFGGYPVIIADAGTYADFDIIRDIVEMVPYASGTTKDSGHSGRLFKPYFLRLKFVFCSA